MGVGRSDRTPVRMQATLSGQACTARGGSAGERVPEPLQERDLGQQRQVDLLLGHADRDPLAGLQVAVHDLAVEHDAGRRALAAVADQREPVAWFVLNVEANVEVDSTGLDALEDLRAELAGSGVVFALARAKQDLLAASIA